MRLQIISEPLDIFHRNTFLDPVGPSFKFDRHSRETVGWRRRDPPKEAFLVDDERDGFTRRQRCASISLCFLVCHHGSLLHGGPRCEGLHHLQDGAPPQPGAYAALTVMARGWALAALGNVNVRTPCFRSA